MAPPWIDLIGSEAVTARRCPAFLCEAFWQAVPFALTRHGAGQRVGEAATGESARVFWTRGSCGSAGPGSRQSQRWAEPCRAQLGCPRGAEN